MENGKSKRVVQFLERLMGQFLPNDQIAKKKAYFLNIISVRIALPALNENFLKELVLEKMPLDKKTRFNELYLRLIKLKAITKRTQILHILYKLQNYSPNILYFEPLEGSNNNEIKKVYIKAKHQKDRKIFLLENELINDLCKLLQAQESSYLKTNEETGEYMLEEVSTLAPFYKMTVNIVEIDVLYSKVKGFIEKEHDSRTCELLKIYMKGEMKEYAGFIEKICNEKTAGIKKIHMWCDEPIVRMKWLGILSDSIEYLKGSQILSMIYTLGNTGNISVKDLMSGIFTYTSKAIIEMLELWLTTGQIDDPFSEFFILENQLVGENELWNKKYTLAQDLVPCFFPEDFTKEILSIGKSINFIKTCCHEPWIPHKADSIPELHNIESLKSWVAKLSFLTNQFLLQLVNFKYSLELHFKSLQKYILLGAGDFHQLLMENLISLLGQNSNTIFKHQINSILEMTIRNSSLKHDDIECLNRLDVRILEPSPLDTGWDVFVLDYVFSAPLTTIFSNQAMEVYLRAFKFLWQIKRAQFLMNCSQQWRDMIVYQSYLELKMVFHSFQLLRHEVSHFINNLMSYMIVEVVEANWKVFSTKLTSAQGLDELISVHNEFLSSILEKSFLNDESMYKRILTLVEICVRINTLQQDLLSAASEERSRREVLIRIGTLEELQIFEDFIYDIDQIRTEFYNEFKDFYLKVTSAKSIHLTFLAFRLDFNEYYELKQLEG